MRPRQRAARELRAAIAVHALISSESMGRADVGVVLPHGYRVLSSQMGKRYRGGADGAKYRDRRRRDGTTGDCVAPGERIVGT